MIDGRLSKTIAAVVCAAAILAISPARAETWEYSNNGKGNHYLMAQANPYSVTFACNGTKVIGFFSIPLAVLDEKFKRAKVIYSVARVDGDARGDGSYAWFSGSADAGKTDVDIDMNSGAQLVKLLRDLGTAEQEISISVTLENPAKGRFATRYAAVFPVDGAADAVSQLFEPAKSADPFGNTAETRRRD